ncbi:MAG TPA: cation:proton antiporter [Bryobacteraceae bacterium]|nr:cation:proton antiporter [Bryobacteraceae bacterium]
MRSKENDTDAFLSRSHHGAGSSLGARDFLWRLHQPLILGYVFAGLILSPLTPGLQIHDIHSFEVMAEVGVVLLMFSIGTEFSLPAMLRLKWVALLGAPIGISLTIALSAVVGMLFGWPTIQSFTVGCIISVASTMVLMRLLMDRGEQSSETGHIMVTLTLVEDLVVVFLTMLLPAFGVPDRGGLQNALWDVGKALILIGPIIFVAWRAVPRLLARVGRAHNDEIAVLLALTICMGVASITAAAGLSLALGAFIGGLILGSSHYAHRLVEKIFPIRDVLVAVFFVTVGMLIDPVSWLASWHIFCVMVGLIVIGKFAVWFLIVRSFGYSSQTALRVGLGLTQIGELSFVLAQVALQSNLITASVYHATLSASLVSIVANATLFKLVPIQRGPKLNVAAA